MNTKVRSDEGRTFGQTGRNGHERRKPRDGDWHGKVVFAVRQTPLGEARVRPMCHQPVDGSGWSEETLKEKKTTKVAEPKRSRGGFYFGPPPKEVETKPKRVKKAPPELAAKARELRDRYMEAFNNAQVGDVKTMLASGKYEITRRVEQGKAMNLLAA